MLVLGVGNLKPNDYKEGEEEGEEESEVAKEEVWRSYLDGDGALKTWREVTALKANKVNLGLALRDYMREAWGRLFLFIAVFPI